MRRRSIQNPGPMCTQLGSGTVDLLNWMKMALYLAFTHRCPLCFIDGLKYGILWSRNGWKTQIPPSLAYKTLQ